MSTCIYIYIFLEKSTVELALHVIHSDTAKLTGHRTLADKRWVGPVKLLCIIMFDISKIRPKSILGPVKAQKFSRCLYIYIRFSWITQWGHKMAKFSALLAIVIADGWIAGDLGCPCDFTAMMSSICLSIYRQTSNISSALVSNEIVYHSDAVWASPVSATRTTSSIST